LWLAGGALSGAGTLQAIGGGGGAAGGYAGAGGVGGNGRVRLNLSAMGAWAGTIQGVLSSAGLPSIAVPMMF
jgi:hypothetical protein